MGSPIHRALLEWGRGGAGRGGEGVGPFPNKRGRGLGTDQPRGAPVPAANQIHDLEPLQVSAFLFAE